MMDAFEAEKVIAKHRGNAIVVTAETASHEWPQISSTDLDLPFHGSMGMASSLGLGLALAAPGRKVIILDADGSLLMNLNSLVTIANMAPSNLIHFVLENGIYRTTGGQPIPNAGKVSFTGLAKASGYPHAHEFDKLDDLEGSIETIMNQAGPTLVCLKIPPITESTPYPFPSSAELLTAYGRLRKTLGGSSN
ncbi:thiamine pyrophosphate-dependent enzyme [Chloroflexota bacterium]